ncbi:zinc ribbon domain-containing protein [Thermophilibacter sp. ZX-H3]|uniref:zinc ribbon domain-containing protein n=1 Tax=unclassified Thermophilibacter TaxID=2847308 RepID=UPI004040A8E5
MAMTYCPECHARISNRATSCPHCGFSAGAAGGLVPIGSLPPTPKTVEILVPGAEVFDDGTSIVPHETKRRLGELLSDAGEVARLAPAVYDAIRQAMAERGTVWAADFSKAAQRLMDECELVISVEKETGALLPQLRSVKTGRIYEKARLHAEQLPDNLASSIAAMQLQLSMGELLSEIRDVARGVERLHLEGRGDRIGRAKAVWYQLQQAAHIRDARLREQRILDIAGSATDQRGALQESFSVELSLATGGGKARATGEAAREAITDLTIISLMARTEFAAYSLIEEPDAAMAALGQLGEFMRANRLGETETLRRLNSISDQNMEGATDGLCRIAQNVMRALGAGPRGRRTQLSGAEEE